MSTQNDRLLKVAMVLSLTDIFKALMNITLIVTFNLIQGKRSNLINA